MEIFATARLGFGIWKAFKKIYKLAEERHDAAMFGVLAQLVSCASMSVHDCVVSTTARRGPPVGSKSTVTTTSSTLMGKPSDA